MTDQPFNAGNAFDDLEDEAFWAEPTPAPGLYARAERAAAEPVITGQYRERCGKCAGSGYWRPGYPCFACKGQGSKSFRTAPEARAKARGASQAKRVQALADKAAQAQAWREANPELWAWMVDAAKRDFEFAVSMIEVLNKWGSLTERQEAAVRGAAAKSAARKAQWAAEKAAKEAARPEVSVARIETAFATARASGLVDDLKLRLGDFTFEPGRNDASVIWVREGRTNVAKITGGRLVTFRACSTEASAAILAIAADPKAAAIAYGKERIRCSCCGAKLTNAVSREYGIGPICRARWGF